MTLTASVPDADTAARLAHLPEDIELLVWNGQGEPPAGSERIEYFVGAYGAVPPAETLAALPALKVVQILSAGVEPWLPLLPEGVLLCNGRGVHGATTAELAVAGMLSVLRQLPRFEDARRAGRWDPVPSSTSLVGRRVLILGAGDIGGRIAAVARALDATVTTVARTARDGVHTLDELPALLPQHEVVVLALPLTEQTRGLVDAGFLAAMPDGALLVNIARGGHVDTDALLAELTAGRLHAFLDVTDPEPLPAGHPLWSAPNLLLTPHVGGGADGWEQRGADLIGAQLLRLRAGEPLENQVRSGY